MFSFRAPRELKIRVATYAAANELSIAGVCIEALTQYLERTETGTSARDFVKQLSKDKA